MQSAHTTRRVSGTTDWHAIRILYDALLQISASPVVEINRAVAITGTDGPQAGLVALDAVGNAARLADYQPYWAARAGFLARLGRGEEAATCYAQAIGLERDPAVRRFLQDRLADLPLRLTTDGGFR